MRQLSFTLESSLVQQFPDFRDVIKASVYSCGRAFKAIAADLDMSVSELSRKLTDNPADPVHFPVHRLPELVRATGDKRPILWLVESFLDDPDLRKQHAVDRIEQLVPELLALVKEARAADAQPLKAVR
ncbi:MAG: hypothetical protein EPO27_10500 [Betaproteobacteria bacterium]|nr:MAG: hypothetical protein EPO27_10500 [Betaproteobacteria bacterium]